MTTPAPAGARRRWAVLRGRHAILAAGAAAASLLAIAGCSAGSGGSPASSAPGSTAPPSTASVTVTTTAPPSSSAPASSGASSTGARSSAATTDDCANAQLAISVRGLGGASEHGAYALEFRNISSRTCTLHGYPGADAVRTGKPPVHAARTVQGYMGGSRRGVPTVHLSPGQSGSAVLEYSNIRSDPSGDACAMAPRIAVTAPNTTRSVTLRATVSVCSLQIHPTVQGTSGDAG